jgi:hypothetical protein
MLGVSRLQQDSHHHHHADEVTKQQHSVGEKDDDDTSYSSANFGGAKTIDLHNVESADTTVAAVENK